MINYNHLLFFTKDWVKYLVTGTWRESLSLSSGPGPSLPPSLSPSLFFFPFFVSLFMFFFFFPSSYPSVLNHSQGLSLFLNSHCLTSESLGFLLASLNFLWSQNCCLLSYYEIFYLIIASVDLNHSLHPPVMKRRRRTVIDIFMELLAYNKP